MKDNSKMNSRRRKKRRGNKPKERGTRNHHKEQYLYLHKVGTKRM